MSKGGWARLKQQQQQDATDGAYIQVHKSKCQAPSQAHMIQQHTDNTTLASTSTSSSLSTASSPSTTSSLSAFSPDPPRSDPIVDPGNSIKAGKLLQLVRRWKARTAASSSPHRSSPNSARSVRNLVPLRCISFSYSDHEEEEENEGDVDNQSKERQSPCEEKIQSTPRRALSCPKLRSPLSSCTPSPIRMYGIDAEEEAEALESLQPKREEGVPRGGMMIRRASSLPPLQKHNVSKQASTPKGYLALYVGEERKRFLVKANLVNHPLFSVLLEKAKEEFGFDQQGPLNIPCEIDFFQHIMLLVAESNHKKSKV